MNKTISAFLWRNANTATVDSLIGESKGQYDIRLTSIDFIDFFKTLHQKNHTAHGGFEIVVPIESFDGLLKVDEKEVIIRFMGKKSARKDWYIRAQRPDTAYDLWREKRGFLSKKDVGNDDYIIIARDSDNKFHARWVRSHDFQDLPLIMRDNISKAAVGWCEI